MEETYSFDDIVNAAAEDPDWGADEETKEMVYFLADSLLWL